MSARVVQQFVSREIHGEVDPLMPAMGPNLAGVIGPAVAAGVFRSMLRWDTIEGSVPPSEREGNR